MLKGWGGATTEAPRSQCPRWHRWLGGADSLKIGDLPRVWFASLSSVEISVSLQHLFDALCSVGNSSLFCTDGQKNHAEGGRCFGLG